MAAEQTHRDTVLAALERLLEWPELARSPQLSGFLDYIVRQTVDGNAQGIKAYAIAVDVFGRAPGFDPQADPIVRVQARRLRALLEEYYNGPGAAEPLRISLPTGRYVPDFTIVAADGVEAPTPADHEPKPRQHRVGALVFAVALLVVLILATGILVYQARLKPRGQPETSPDYPRVMVAEFQEVGNDDSGVSVAGGLAVELVTDLSQFDMLRVGYRDGTAVESGTENNSFVLTGIARIEADQVRYSAILTSQATDAVVWNKVVVLPIADARREGALDAVSRHLSLALGSPRGPLHAAVRKTVLDAAAEPPAAAYTCWMLFALYREQASRAAADRVMSCIRALPATVAERPSLLAARASLFAEAGGVADETTPERIERIRTAEGDLRRAIALAPTNSFVWEQHGRLEMTVNHRALARSDFSSALQLNGADADLLAIYAQFLVFGGAAEDGRLLSDLAVLQSPDPPSWYFAVPSLLAYLDGRYADALDAAQRYAPADRSLGPILAIMAAQRLGDEDVVNRYLPQVLDSSAFRSSGIMPPLRSRIADQSILSAIRTSLLDAGLSEAMLFAPF